LIDINLDIEFPSNAVIFQNENSSFDEKNYLIKETIENYKDFKSLFEGGSFQCPHCGIKFSKGCALGGHVSKRHKLNKLQNSTLFQTKIKKKRGRKRKRLF